MAKVGTYAHTTMMQDRSVANGAMTNSQILTCLRAGLRLPIHAGDARASPGGEASH